MNEAERMIELSAPILEELKSAQQFMVVCANCSEEFVTITPMGMDFCDEDCRSDYEDMNQLMTATRQQRITGDTMLMLVMHQPSGEVYTLRQHPAGHCEEIVGPYYVPDYRNGEEWALETLRLDHVDSDCQTENVEWADGEQWQVIAELE